MSDAFSVFPALPALGFQLDGLGLGLEFKHPQCELGAVQGRTPLPVVAFAGHYHCGGHAMGTLEFNLPEMVQSHDQLKAFLAYYLRDAFTTSPPDWVLEGRALSRLLPWEREKEAYEARDRCVVRREWLKLALKDLDAALEDGPEWVTVMFDGTLLTIDCGRRILVPARGVRWSIAYAIRAADLRPTSGYLRGKEAEVSAWKGQLSIANRRYRAVPAAETSAGESFT